MNKFPNKCPMCGRWCEITLSDEQYGKLHKYHNREGLIQELFPELNAVEREFIKTGYCPGCQEEIFGNGETYKITWRSKDGK